MMFYYQIFPTGTLVWLPAFFITCVLSHLLARGYGFRRWNVQYRDVRYTVPFLLNYGFLLRLWFTRAARYTAMAYHSWIESDDRVVEGFRWALFGIGEAPGAMIYTSMGVSLLLVFTGLIYFNRMEKTFADVVMQTSPICYQRVNSWVILQFVQRT